MNSLGYCTPTKRRIEELKRDLPPVRVTFNGRLWWGKVTGRLNRFASVSPYQREEHGRIITILGPIVTFSWPAVCRAVVSGVPLDCDPVDVSG